MKRFYCAVCALAITISAGSALALEKMDAKAKSDMTGQAGVTLTFDNLVQTVSVTGAGWYDENGIGTGTPAGGMVYASINATNPIRIEMDGTVKIDAGTNYTPTTATGITGSYVALTFDNLVTDITKLDVKLALSSDTTMTAFGTVETAKSLGQVVVSNMQITMASGNVLISAH